MEEKITLDEKIRAIDALNRLFQVYKQNGETKKAQEVSEKLTELLNSIKF